MTRFALALIALSLAAACGSSPQNMPSGGYAALSGSLACTTCPIEMPLTGNLTATYQRGADVPGGPIERAPLDLVLHVRSSGDVVLVPDEDPEEPFVLAVDGTFNYSFQYTCLRQGTGVITVTTETAGALAFDIVCTPGAPVRPDPRTARTRGSIELRVARSEGGPPRGQGAVLAFDDRIAATGPLDAYRDDLLAKPLDPTPSCDDFTGFPPLPEQVSFMPSPMLPAADGGTPLTFMPPFDIADPAAVQPGRRFDGMIAAQPGFAGVNTPNLVRIPAMPTITSGMPITSGNLMGWAQPGRFHGRFPSNTTNLPSVAWSLPPEAPTSILVRITDFHFGVPGDTVVIFCSLPGTATAYTMDQPTFDRMDLSAPDPGGDFISIDVSFVNVDAGAVGGSNDDAFLSVADSTFYGSFFQKAPPM